MFRVNWNPKEKQVRWFGLVFMIGFLIISAILGFRGHQAWAGRLAIFCSAIGIFSMAFPGPGLFFYRIWMAVGFCMGFVMSKIILALIFFGVFTPVALLFKIIGRDKLELRKRDVVTYWHVHPEIDDKTSYEHLF